MSLRDIDEALKNWNTRLAAAAQNVMDLQAHPTYRRLVSMDGSLSGKTAREAALTAYTVARLLEYYELLQHTVGRVEEMRRNMPVLSFNVDQREAEMKAVMEGASIQMPAVQVPLEKRGLLGSMEQVDRITPAGLLDVMSKAFEEAKAKVLAIDGAFETLGRSIEQAERHIAGLESENEFLSGPERGRLRQAACKLEDLKSEAARDPLSTSEQMAGQVTSLVDDLSKAVEQRQQKRADVQSALRRADATLAEAKEAARAANEAHSEASLKIAGFSAAAATQARELDALGEWLERLRKKLDEGAWDAVAVGIRNWANAAQTLISSLRAVTEKAKRALELRAELRGRMEAFKAKARALNVAEEPDLSALAEKARVALNGKPCDLAVTGKLVGEYEAKLNFRAARNVRS